MLPRALSGVCRAVEVATAELGTMRRQESYVKGRGDGAGTAEADLACMPC